VFCVAFGEAERLRRKVSRQTKPSSKQILKGKTSFRSDGYVWYNLTLAVKRAPAYHLKVIKSFKCKETEKIFNLESSKRIPSGIQQIALRKLRMLHRSTNIADLRIPPANRLEKLSGNRTGQWSIRVNNQWRICFEWHDGHAFKVEIVDYH
jgi:proteic killer suppression protein